MNKWWELLDTFIIAGLMIGSLTHTLNDSSYLFVIVCFVARIMWAVEK